MTPEFRHLPVRSQCSDCAALCCMALAIDKGDRFAIDKPAGEPCPNLDGLRCRIHADLSDEGFAGCVAYDCLGAGQRVVQELYSGKSWHNDPALTEPMICSFRHMRLIHDVLAVLAYALPRLPEDEATRIRAIAAPLTAELTPQQAETLAASGLPTQIKTALRAFPELLHT